MTTRSSEGVQRALRHIEQHLGQPLSIAELADMAGQRNDVSTRSKWLDEIVKADKAAGGARTDRSRYLAAKATLESATPAVASFDAAKLKVPLDKSLKQKRAAMEKVLAIYGRALDYQVAEVTTAATYGMAELYRQLGADLIVFRRGPILAAITYAGLFQDVDQEQQIVDRALANIDAALA